MRHCPRTLKAGSSPRCAIEYTVFSPSLSNSDTGIVFQAQHVEQAVAKRASGIRSRPRGRRARALLQSAARLPDRAVASNRSRTAHARRLAEVHAVLLCGPAVRGAHEQVHRLLHEARVVRLQRRVELGQIDPSGDLEDEVAPRVKRARPSPARSARRSTANAPTRDGSQNISTTPGSEGRQKWRSRYQRTTAFVAATWLARGERAGSLVFTTDRRTAAAGSTRAAASRARRE